MSADALPAHVSPAMLSSGNGLFALGKGITWSGIAFHLDKILPAKPSAG